MKKTNQFFLRVILFSVLAMLIQTSCKKGTHLPGDDDDPIVSEFFTGLTGDDNIDSIPKDFRINLGSVNVPSAVDLTNRFPPVGNQGAYGTCVAWAAGYGLKTALNAIDNGLMTSDLTSPGRQSSPTDLFLAIPDNQKGSNCDGTSFEPAFDVMIRRGLASMDVAPYENFGDCSQTLLDPSWASHASNNKLANYRRIDNDVDVFKEYLAKDRPILIGMFTDQQFGTWRGEDVKTTQGAQSTGIHGRHAMVIVGYDDARGPGGAFKILNSWGENWGADGFIWVDYQLTVSPDFLMFGFVANNDVSNIDPDDIPPTVAGDYNLMPWIERDDINTNGQSFRDRILTYNIYNLGNETLSSSTRWSMIYLYYNAFDLNDNGVLLYDYYTDEFGNKGEDGPLSANVGLAGNWWTNVDLPGRSGMAQTVTNNNSDVFTWTYTMPDNLNGFYYLVAITDPENVVKESNESNNYQFLTNEFGGPVLIDNGVVIGLQSPDNENMAKSIQHQTDHVSPSPAELSEKYCNAYAPEEVIVAAKSKLRSGELHIATTNTRRVK